MSLQQNQIDQLADWLTQAEKKIEKQDSIGSDLEAVKAQVDEHKVSTIYLMYLNLLLAAVTRN